MKKRTYLLTYTPPKGDAEKIRSTINSIVFLEFSNYKTKIRENGAGYVTLEDITEREPILLKIYPEHLADILKDSSFREW